jgi:mannosyltransferase OCH1-like enzyme
MKKLIHRIWIGPAEMPEEYKFFGDEWERLNPDWKVVDWDEVALGLDRTEAWINSAVLDDLLDKGAQPGADKIALATHLADVLAYEIVYRYGGLYVNTDMQPVRSLDNLFERNESLETNPAAGKEDDYWVVNAVLWAPEPNMDFWLAVIKQLPVRYFSMPGEYMSNTTGPHLLTQVYQGRRDLVVLDKTVFNPLHFSQVNYGEDAVFDLDDLPAETITVHHWGHRRNRRNQRVLEP